MTSERVSCFVVLTYRKTGFWGCFADWRLRVSMEFDWTSDLPSEPSEYDTNFIVEETVRMLIEERPDIKKIRKADVFFVGQRFRVSERRGLLQVSNRTSLPNAGEPSVAAQKLLLFLTPIKDQDDILEHFEQLFHCRKAQFGLDYAYLWYWTEIVKFALSTLWTRVLELSEKLKLS